MVAEWWEQQGAAVGACERCEQCGVVVEWWEQRGAVAGVCEGCEQGGVVRGRAIARSSGEQWRVYCV